MSTDKCSSHSWSKKFLSAIDSITENHVVNMQKATDSRLPSSSDTSTIQLLYPRLSEHSGRVGGKIVRSRGLGCLLSDCIFYVCQKSWTHEISVTWLLKEALSNDNTRQHGNADGEILQCFILGEKRKAINDCWKKETQAVLALISRVFGNRIKG